jgi:hypothetical protein
MGCRQRYSPCTVWALLLTRLQFYNDLAFGWLQGDSCGISIHVQSAPCIRRGLLTIAM